MGKKKRVRGEGREGGKEGDQRVKGVDLGRGERVVVGREECDRVRAGKGFYGEGRGRRGRRGGRRKAGRRK